VRRGQDNDAASGTKGDYIYSEFSDDGVEYISINTHNHGKRRRPRNPGPSSL
jgi:hypothetical protein